jgi:hypothetical protein
MQQSCTYGSVRGASGNWRPYRDKRPVSGQIRNPHYAEFELTRCPTAR